MPLVLLHAVLATLERPQQRLGQLAPPRVDLIERGRGALLVDEFRAGWPSFRGRAVEPLVRDSLEWLLPDGERFGAARYVGGYWNLVGVSSRGFDPNVPLDVRLEPADLVDAWRGGVGPFTTQSGRRGRRFRSRG